MIIETIVLMGRTYKPIIAITQPRSMFFHHINHFVDEELKEFASAPEA
jgi:hypothetical protein